MNSIARRALMRSSPLSRTMIHRSPFRSFTRNRTYQRRFSVAVASAGVYTGATSKFGNSMATAYLLFVPFASAWWYRDERKKHLAGKDKSHDIALIDEPSDFVHPLGKEGYLYKWYLVFARYIYLTLLFTPVTCLFLLSSLTQSGVLYQKSLDYLETTLQYAGCGFQKFAQWLSMRPDKFHPDLIEVASKFRESAPHHSLEDSKRLFREAFGLELDDVFETFDEKAIASGTIAQVHRATLKPEYMPDHLDNPEVAVKILHQSILTESFTDPDLIMNFLQMSFSIFQACLPIKREQFAKVLQEQIDLEREAYNMQKFEKNFQNDSNISFPTVCPDLCSETIIVESFESGNALGPMMKAFDDHIYGYNFKAEGSEKYGKEFRESVAKNIFDFGMKMYVRDNFAHADFHAGNMLAKDDGSIVVLDTGIVTELQPHDLDKFYDFMEASCRQQSKRFTELIFHFNETKDTEATPAKLEKTVQSLMDEHLNIETPAYGSFYGEVIKNLDRHNILLRGDVATAVINMGVMEGLIRSLDNDFDIGTNAIPYFVNKRLQDRLKLDQRTIDFDSFSFI